MNARELLDQQRTTMSEEIQALLDVSDDGIGHIVEYGARWGTALRAVIDEADKAEHGATRWADPLPVPEWVDTIRAAISTALEAS
jgi:hypothetical protein